MAVTYGTGLYGTGTYGAGGGITPPAFQANLPTKLVLHEPEKTLTLVERTTTLELDGDE